MEDISMTALSDRQHNSFSYVTEYEEKPLCQQSDRYGACLKLIGTCLDGLKSQGQLAAASRCESETAIDECIMALEDAHSHIYDIKSIADDFLNEIWSIEERQAQDDERRAYLGNQL
jgi:hypothetical protein